MADTDPGARLDADSAKKIAQAFLAGIGRDSEGDWECIETDNMDRPNRFDYRLTYRDKAFKADGLQRKLSLTISGDKVTGFGTPWYDVPDEWSRNREVRQKALRNKVREVISLFLFAGLAIFFVVRVVMLIRRRVAQRNDVKRALCWALALGALPALLQFVNTLPGFYDAYFFQTEESISTYTLTKLLGAVMYLLWMPIGVFLLFVLARMILRAWMPERGELGVLFNPLRPSYWGSTENRYGMVLGLATVGFDLGLNRLIDCLKALLAPDLFSPSATNTEINVNQVSELLNLADKIPQAIILSLILLVIVVTFRRFIKGERRIIAVFVLFMALIADGHSLSWYNLLIDWSLEMMSAIILYYVVTRVLRWNLMAYLVWLWTTINLEAIPNFKRFAFSASPEFFWPSIEQMAVLLLPIMALFLYGFRGKVLGLKAAWHNRR